MDAIEERGQDFFRVVCERDLEGIVREAEYGPYYSDGLRTNWLKISEESDLFYRWRADTNYST